MEGPQQQERRRQQQQQSLSQQEWTLTRASNHYQSGQFEKSAQEFRRAKGPIANNEELNANDDATMASATAGPERTRLQLRIMAIRADESLCEFRSALHRHYQLHKGSNHDNEPMSCWELLKRARRDNGAYLDELQGDIHYLSIKLDRHHNINIDSGDLASTRKPNISIDHYKLQLAMAVLTATVTRSWLYLHHNTIGLRSGSIQQSQSKAISITILKRGISLASCPFVYQNASTFSPTWDEAMTILQNARKKASNSVLYQPEAERLLYALRMFINAARVVGLGIRDSGVQESSRSLCCTLEDRLVMGFQIDSRTGMMKMTELMSNDDLVQSEVKELNVKTMHNTQAPPASASENDSHQLHSGKKRNSRAEDPSMSVSAKRGKYSNPKSDNEIQTIPAPKVVDRSKLALQEHLVDAIHHHLEGLDGTSLSDSERMKHKKQRDNCLRRSLDIEKHGLAGKLNTMFHAIDMLQLQKKGDPGNSGAIAREELIDHLKTLSSTNVTSASLLGCIYSQCNDYEKALECFERTLKLEQTSTRTYSQVDIYRDSLSNVAQCFGMLGDPGSMLEVLLHWIHTFNNNEEDNAASFESQIERSHVRPLYLHLNKYSPDAAEIGEIERKKSSVLHRIYYAAMLLEDWVSCQNALKELSNKALIQFDGGFVAFETGKVTKVNQSFQNDSNCIQQQLGIYSFMDLISSIDEANAIFARFSTNTESGGNNVSTMELKDGWRVAQTKLSHALLIWNKLKANLSCLGPDALSIEGCLLNNFGMALVLNGRQSDAMVNFQKSMKCFESGAKFHSCNENKTIPLTYSHAMSNLSLISCCQASTMDH